MGDMEQLADLVSRENTPELICACAAKIFRVRQTEVALLEMAGRLLRFVHPPELHNAGAIPLSSSAIAARTARTKRAEIFNDFTRVRHSSVFEVVKLGESGEEDVIQKLMSAPILGNDAVVGVIQVSRKAYRLSAAGPDFMSEDLAKLESVAAVVGKLMAK